MFYFIISILLIGFLVDQVLERLNLTHASSVLEPEISDLAKSEKYRKHINYKTHSYYFSLVNGILSLGLLLGILQLGGFGWLDQLLRSYVNSELLVSIGFFGILFMAMDLLSLPFSLYDTFVIEEKFGMNTMTLKTFFLDKLKSYLIGILLGGGLLVIMLLIFIHTKTYFWLLAWMVLIVFSLFVNYFYTSFLLPVFNTLSPLEEGSLKQGIQKLCLNADFKLDGVFVIDGSKRSNAANAFFSGFGARKKIVLYDTLLSKLSEEEVLAVLAHEIGHFKLKHVIYRLFGSFFQTGMLLFVFSLFVDNKQLVNALGSNTPSFHLTLIGFGLIFSPISSLIGLGSNYLSRRNEFAADRFAKSSYSSSFLIKALVKLSESNLSNLSPHPLYVFVHYSHPPLNERIKSLKK